MIKSKSNRKNLVWVFAFLLIVLNCKFNEKTFDLNKKFNIKKDEVIRVNQTNLRVKLLGAGHDITESGGSSYCNIELNYNENYFVNEVYVGNSAEYYKYIVEVIAVDERGDAKGSDPFANTNCTFLVKRK